MHLAIGSSDAYAWLILAPEFTSRRMLGWAEERKQVRMGRTQPDRRRRRLWRAKRHFCQGNAFIQPEVFEQRVCFDTRR